MMVSCEIRLEYCDEKTARAVLDAVNVDNEGFVKSEIDGKYLVFRASGKDAMSVSHTVNDLLACVKAAENSLL